MSVCPHTNGYTHILEHRAGFLWKEKNSIDFTLDVCAASHQNVGFPLLSRQSQKHISMLPVPLCQTIHKVRTGPWEGSNCRGQLWRGTPESHCSELWWYGWGESARGTLNSLKTEKTQINSCFSRARAGSWADSPIAQSQSLLVWASSLQEVEILCSSLFGMYFEPFIPSEEGGGVGGGMYVWSRAEPFLRNSLQLNGWWVGVGIPHFQVTIWIKTYCNLIRNFSLYLCV